MPERRPAPGRSLWRESGAGSLGGAAALVAGLGLDVGMALILGADQTTDALFVALRIPLGIAVFFPPTATQVLVPEMKARASRGEESLNAITGAAAIATFCVTSLIAAAGSLAAPLLVRMQAPGLAAADLELAGQLGRVAFWLVPLTATAQVFRAYRYAQGRQGIASALQGVVGVTVLGFLLALAGRLGVHAVVLGYVAGGGLMLIFVWAVAKSGGYRLKGSRGELAGLRTLGRRSLSPLAASGVQLGVRLVEQFVASFLLPGSITIIGYANRLVGAIGGTLLFQPIATAFLGRLSHEHTVGNKDGSRRLVVDGLRVMSIVSLGLMVLVALAAPPLVAAVFGLGVLTPEQGALLAVTVAVYALSLPTASFQRILLAATFARGDTVIYLHNTALGAVMNIVALGVLTTFLSGQWGLLSIPVAYALAQTVNVWHADRAVRARWGSPIWPGREMAKSLLVIVIGAVVMAITRLSTSPTLTADVRQLFMGGLATAAIGSMVLLVGLIRWAPLEFRQSLTRVGT